MEFITIHVWIRFRDGNFPRTKPGKPTKARIPGSLSEEGETKSKIGNRGILGPGTWDLGILGIQNPESRIRNLRGISEGGTKNRRARSSRRGELKLTGVNLVCVTNYKPEGENTFRNLSLHFPSHVRPPHCHQVVQSRRGNCLSRSTLCAAT